MNELTLETLLEKVPEQFRPVIREYGPALLKMTAEEIWAWIELLAAGRSDEAYETIVAKLDSAGRLAEWRKLRAKWQGAVDKNAERIDLQKQASLAVLKVILMAALAVVGL